MGHALEIPSQVNKVLGGDIRPSESCIQADLIHKLIPLLAIIVSVVSAFDFLVRVPRVTPSSQRHSL